MVEFLNETFEVDTYTVVVVALLAGWSGVLTQHVLSKTLLALVFVPGFIFGALVANYLFQHYGIFPTDDEQTNVVVACTLGIIAALLVLLVLTRVGAILKGLRVQRYQFRRY
jgi:ABC-type dipeptide/oligopeptide/nickel transport system permease component